MDKQLRRSRSNKVIAGVCGGLGEYFGMDAILIRIIFLLLVFAAGVSPLLYIILWVVMPQADY